MQEDRDPSLSLARLGWRLDALDEWRKDVVDPAVAALGELTKADEIAEAVANKVNATNTLRLTLVQKSVALLVALTALAGGIKGLVS